MKLCPYCAEEIQDAAVKCKHCGSDLHSRVSQANTVDIPPQPDPAATLGTPGPSPTAQVTCPRCASRIAAKARACPACQFAIWEYNENKNSARKTEMHRCQGNEGYYLLQSYEKESTIIVCRSIGIIFVGMLLCLIPIIGWIGGPLLIIIGTICFFSPVRGRIMIERIAAGDEYKKRKAIAAACAQNTYDNVVCPSCSRVLAGPNDTAMYWPEEGGHIDCDSCRKRSFRFNDSLLHVPHPEVRVTDSLQEYLASATERGSAS